MLRGKCCANVPESENFWLADGKVLRNLLDLTEALNSMSVDTFRSHVNKQKNDFAEWVRNSIKDTKLADDIARTVTKDTVEILVLRRILEIGSEN